MLAYHGSSNKKYHIYAFNKDIPLSKEKLSPENLSTYATEQMRKWIDESDGKLPKDKFRVLINGGKITTDNVENLLSVHKKASDLVRTNVTISAPLFEWAKAKAQKEDTSFSDLVSQGLLTLKGHDKEKDSDKEAETWFKEQGVSFRKKLGDFGSLEIFHYLPNNHSEFDAYLLKTALQNSELKRTGWPIGAYVNGEMRPHPQENGIEAEYTNSPYLLLDYWYAKNKGEFYFSRNLESDSGHGDAKPKTNLYFDTLIWRVAEAFEHCLTYYSNLNVDETQRVKIRISLHGISNRTLGAWNPARAITLHHYICGSDKSSWEKEVTLKELKENLDSTIFEAIKKLIVMFDFFVPSREVVQSILDQEYRKSQM